jgi:glycosyltransferase involved in cell wall biosynthesis
MDEVWVPSRFCMESFVASGVKPEKLRVIPHGVDTARFGLQVQPLQIEGARRFVFLSVFDWIKRKGWDVLLRAYLSEFEVREDVCLVLRIARLNPAELSEFVSRECGGGPRPALLVIPFSLPQELMPNLYAAANAFVLASRGEGWGLPYGEAMAMGLPTIATEWGGHLDFMNETNSYLVETDGMVPMDEETRAVLQVEPGLQWAEPSVDSLRQIMRRVFERPAEAKAKGEAARSTMAAQATWEKAALRVWERAEALGEFREMPLKSQLQAWAERALELGQDEDPERVANAIAARMGELEQAESLASLIVDQLKKRTLPGQRQ